MDKTERARLRALCDKATAGPWDEIHHCLKEAPGHFCCYCGNKATFQSVAWCYGDPAYRHHNIDFIAASRTALPAALDALDAVEEKVDELEATLDDEEAAHQDTLRLLKLREGERDDLRAKLDAAEARVAELEAYKQKLLANARPALEHVYDECRRTIVEAIVRRLRELGGATAHPESCVGYYRAANLIEREFLTEKGGA